MSYMIEFIPQLEDGQWQGKMKVVLMAKRDESMTIDDHASVLAYIHRVSMVGSYWEEDIETFIDYDFWYQNNSGLQTSQQELQ